jgi:hypothetical protein
MDRKRHLCLSRERKEQRTGRHPLGLTIVRFRADQAFSYSAFPAVATSLI